MSEDPRADVPDEHAPTVDKLIAAYLSLVRLGCWGHMRVDVAPGKPAQIVVSGEVSGGEQKRKP